MKKLIALGTISLSVFISGALVGCGKKAESIPTSRLDFLEIEVSELEQQIQKSEAEYLEERAKLEKAKDTNGVRALDAINRERLQNEKKILKMQQKELEKLRKNEK